MTENWNYSDILPEINVLAEKMIDNSRIDPELYTKYNVKRGLRDLDGKGVLTGLTDISTIKQNKLVDGKLVPCDGELYYRGYNVNDIVKGIMSDFCLAQCPTKRSLKALRSFWCSIAPCRRILCATLFSRLPAKI